MPLLRRSPALRSPYPHPGRGSTRLPPGRLYPPKARTTATGMRRFRNDLSTEQLLLARVHLEAVVVPQQVQQPVHERPPPLLADDVGTEDDVAELARHRVGQRVTAVDREREDVRRLVDA